MKHCHEKAANASVFLLGTSAWLAGWLAGPVGTNLMEVPLPCDAPVSQQPLSEKGPQAKGGAAIQWGGGPRAKGGRAGLIDGEFADRLEVHVAVRWQIIHEM